MDVQVTGKKINIGKNLTDHAINQLDIVNKKYHILPLNALNAHAIAYKPTPAIENPMA